MPQTNWEILSFEEWATSRRRRRRRESATDTLATTRDDLSLKKFFSKWLAVDGVDGVALLWVGPHLQISFAVSIVQMTH